MKFSHLHNHTQYSLLDGASSISKLYDKALKDNMPAMAITDHGNMYGVFDFVAQAWKKTKIVGKDENGNDIVEPIVKPVVGCEFYLVNDRHKRQFSKDDKDIRRHQLLLAKNEIGYKNLTKLCSLGFIEGLYGKYPRIDKELLQQYHEGLIATTCCLGAEVPQTILQNGIEAGEKVFKWWLDLFGEDYFVEMQRHDIPDQKIVNEALLQFAKKYNVPIIASNDSHYVEREDWDAHDTLLCINTAAKKTDRVIKDLSEDIEIKTQATRFGFYNDQFYFKSTQEMTDLFQDLPQAIDNTNIIVDRIKPLKLDRDILLPHFKVPTAYNDDQDAYLEDMTWKGAKERYIDISPEAEERIKFELFTIRTMGFAGYFLIVSDFIKAGREMGVFIGPGRGSAAGSVVAYCTGITNIDPIKYNLLFERFLNPERKSMPDIDTDFDDEGRQKVIDYVVTKYGKNQVAHIVTYGTMAAKMSIKDVARVMDLPLNESNALTKLVPDTPGINLKRLLTAPLKGEHSLESENLEGEDLINVHKLRELYEGKNLTGDILRAAEKLEGSVRNTGIHASAIIIAPSDLTAILPIATNKDTELLITQYEGGIIENAGVIKMDFLGLKTLTILKDALKLIKRNHGIVIDLDNLPLDDEKTFELYKKGETNGTFQFESAGMQKYLKDLMPDQFADLIAMNALYRPGPIQYIPLFIKRKLGLETILYDLPEMEEYLGETYGITVYQEQVMLLSQKLAGFSKGDADILRKAMGKKQRSVLDKMKAQFITGATAKGHPEKALDKIWTDWEAFAQYAFNKSHSTCYALVAYQTAYLKAHYPAEYMAAVLNNQNSIDKIKFMMEECQRMNLKVQGPDVNESLSGFSVNKEGVVRFGLNAVKGVGAAAVEDLILERENNGNFKTIYDFISRINQRTVNKKSIESLVLAGGFDSFPELHRAQYFHTPPHDPINGLEKLIRFGNQIQSSDSLSSSLFGAVALPDVQPPQIPFCEPWTITESLEKEKEVIGIYLSAHPLDGFRFEIQNLNITPINRVETLQNKGVRIAGFVSEAIHGTTKKGSKFGKFFINDYSGNLEINLWENNYVQYGNFLQNGQLLLIQGMYQEHKYRPGVMEFMINNMMTLDEASNKLIKCLHLYLPNQNLTNDMVDFFEHNTAANTGNTAVTYHIFEEGNAQKKIKLSGSKIQINEELVQYLEGDNGLLYKLEVN